MINPVVKILCPLLVWGPQASVLSVAHVRQGLGKSLSLQIIIVIVDVY